MFLYMFGMLDFDKNDKVCEVVSKRDNVVLLDKDRARSNYLYLLSKYNQKLAEEMGVKIPDFFKTELSNVLASVENGGNFEKAKALVLSNCVPMLQEIAGKKVSDKKLIETLNECVSLDDELFAKKFSKADNNLHLQYIITNISGSIFDNIFALKTKDLSDVKTKSKLFKEIIKYNGLMLASAKVKNNELSHEEFKTAEPVKQVAFAAINMNC